MTGEARTPQEGPAYLVRLENGLVVQHSAEELATYMKGVDAEAANVLGREMHPTDLAFLKQQLRAQAEAMKDPEWKQQTGC